jgi:hypothetical protein
MLFSAKTGLTQSKSRTPQKNAGMFASTTKQTKKESKGDVKDKSSTKENTGIKYKTKDSYLILQSLEEIYAELSFNEFDVFPVENIEKAKKNIQNLLGFLGEEPTCRYHKDLLNLYCENEKEVVCVSCVYKDKHKNHKVKSL